MATAGAARSNPVSNDAITTQSISLRSALTRGIAVAQPKMTESQMASKPVPDSFAAFSRSVVTPSPAITSRPPTPLAGVAQFARRNLFNKSPVVTDVQINPQGANGVITGDIDGKDPDELGKKVQISSTVWAGAPTPAACGCEQVPGYIPLAFTNPAVLGGNPGDNWHAPNALDSTTVYLNPDYSLAYYTGTETGQVTIDGLGTGNVHLDFVGNLNADGTSEKSVATLNPDLGTGDLKGVEGTVTSESTLNADGTANGVLTGEVVRPEIRYVVVRKPEHGTVTVDEVTGSFVYTADPDFLAAGGGEDSFQVLATDNRANLVQIFKPYNGDPVQTVNLTVV